MSSVSYLLVGHATADLIPDGRVLGGTVSYAAPVAAAFGHDVKILTSAAPDEPLLQALSSFVDLRVIPAAHTTTFENVYNPQGRTQYVHHTANRIEAKHIPPDWHDVELLHIAPLVDEVDLSITQEFPDARVLLTPQGYLREWNSSGLVRFKRWYDTDALQNVDILICSREDIHGAPELEHAFAEVVPHVIITRGRAGGIYYHEGQPYHYAAFPADEIDPTGAGDVFAASLFASLPFFNGRLKPAITVAAQLAAKIVAISGVKFELTAADIQDALKDADSQ